LLAKRGVIRQFGFIMQPPSVSSAPQRRNKVERMIWWSIALLLLLFTLVVPVVSISRAKHRARRFHEEVRPEIARTEQNMRELGSALRQFHLENGTDTAPYPSDIRQLESMGFTTNIEELLKFGDTDNPKWLYFSAADSENGSAPLLISPSIRNRRLVLRIDQSVAPIREDQLGDLINSSPVPPDEVAPSR